MTGITIEAHIHYRHATNEVMSLSAAIVPMADSIKAVSYPQERTKMRSILDGGYFRAKQSTSMVSMLSRACKHARANLSDYFPGMRSDVLVNVQNLENAVADYQATFRALKNETIPTP